MKMQKDTFGIYVLQSLDPEKLGEKEESRWRNTCVSWVYRNVRARRSADAGGCAAPF